MGSISPPSAVQRVAVIGAGPSGLAAAKYLAAEKVFSTIDVFEQRADVGGVWIATPDLTEDPGFTVPRTLPTKQANVPSRRSGKDGDTLEFLSPVYDSLDTNIPHTMMNYSQFKFPQGGQLFPEHTVVRSYLDSYADEIRHLIRFDTQVREVRPVGESSQWQVTTKDLRTAEEVTAAYDAVIAANGHYDDPFVPDISGLQDFDTKHPGTVTHSKFYRHPEDFTGKKVIIIGHSASGIDIASQVSPLAAQPLLVSERSPTNTPPTSTTTPHFVAEIAAFLPATRGVRFTDSTTAHDLDAIIFCTGYLYSYPFLTHLPRPATTTGGRVRHLYQHLFYHPRPSLAFLALPQRIVPFPVAEAQAAVVARVLAGRLDLPARAEMEAWEAERVAETGDGKAFHVLGFPADAEYLNALGEWARAARREGEGGVGKEAPVWGPKERWARERAPAIKKAQMERRARGERVSTMEELGFDYEAWEREQEEGGQSV